MTEDRAAALACRCLLRLGSDVLPADPEEMLRRSRGVLVVSAATAAGWLNCPEEALLERCADSEAFTLRGAGPDGKPRVLVVCATRPDPLRLRFTLAHELGHVVLGHRGCFADPVREAEASRFASHLLCPEPVLDAAAAACPSLCAEHVAALCGVSVTAAETAWRRPRAAVRPELMMETAALLVPRCLERLPRGGARLGWHPLPERL